MQDTPQYSIDFPSYFDDDEVDIIEKGVFQGVIIRSDGRTYAPVFYSPLRLQQTIAIELAERPGYFVEPHLLVIQIVNRAHIEVAVKELASRKFWDLNPVSE